MVKKEKISGKQKPLKPKTPFMVKFSFLMVFVLLALFYPSTVLFCGGMMPTLVAAIVDNKKQKTAWITVGAMNFAGFLPVWWKLWERGHTIDQSFFLLMDANNLLLMYGAAAVGWFLYLQVPVVVGAVISRQGEKRLKDIGKRQQELIRKWGKGVTGQ